MRFTTVAIEGDTYKIAGVARGGGAGRGLATVHRGLDGSRPIEQATGSTSRKARNGRRDGKEEKPASRQIKCRVAKEKGKKGDWREREIE